VGFQRRVGPSLAGGNGARVDAGVGRTELADSQHTASADGDTRTAMWGTAAVAAAATAAVARDTIDENFVFGPDHPPIAPSLTVVFAAVSLMNQEHMRQNASTRNTSNTETN
jgi:hypothetical protein